MTHKIQAGARECSSAVESMPSAYEALGSNASFMEKKKKEGEKQKEKKVGIRVTFKVIQVTCM